MDENLRSLAEFIARGERGADSDARTLLMKALEARYYARDVKSAHIRDSLGGNTPAFAGLIHPNNPPSGPYGGTSLIWFPSETNTSIITFVVGTGGLSPDEGLLSRPGHRRRIQALRRFLVERGVDAWTKSDPASLGLPLPDVVHKRFPGHKGALERYGPELYMIATVPEDVDAACLVVQAFLDLYAYERGWTPLGKKNDAEFNSLVTRLRADTFTQMTSDQVHELLMERRFVVLQGPPGTGKTRMAEQIKEGFFSGYGRTVQFHPAVTYEDFMVGLSPDPAKGTLHFRVRPGWLIEAARAADSKPYLLVIDEMNRADLGRVLGEAIYLFEPDLGGEAPPRTVELPHAVDGQKSFRLPKNLYILGTMNTADRSIAHMDLAIRRRFAFVTLPPNQAAVQERGIDLASTVFGQLMDVFIEHAPDEVLLLLPGHSYFFGDNLNQLVRRFRHELLPLLDEYMSEGLVSSFASELRAVRDQIEDVVRDGDLIQ